MWDKIQMGLFLVFVLFCAFTLGRYYDQHLHNYQPTEMNHAK